MAEIELSVLARQCLAERMDNREHLAKEVTAWQHARNAATCKIDWRFTTADARVKLKRLYPVVLPRRSTSLPPGDRRGATRSDLWRAYQAAFPARTHRCCGERAGETCHVEHWFCTLRQRVSRLVRKALSFSKHAENHLDAMHFFIASYNLAIKESTLN